MTKSDKEHSERRCSYLEWVETTVITGSSLFLTCSQKLRLYDPWPCSWEQNRQLRELSRLVKPVAHRWLGLILWQTLTLVNLYCKHAISCNHAIPTLYLLYIPSKNFRLVDQCEVAKIYIICARVFVSVIFFAGYLQYLYCIIQYHIVRTAILLAEICNFHIYYIFLTSIYSFKYHIRVQGAKIS